MNMKINDNWRVENKDSMNYNLIERVELDQTKTAVKNTHREVVRGHYGSLKGALIGYVDRKTDTMQIEGSVIDLINIINEVKEEIKGMK